MTEVPSNSTGSSIFTLKGSGEEGKGGRGPESNDLCACSEAILEAGVTMDWDRFRFGVPFCPISGSEISEILFLNQLRDSLKNLFDMFEV